MTMYDGMGGHSCYDEGWDAGYKACQIAKDAAQITAVEASRKAAFEDGQRVERVNQTSMLIKAIEALTAEIKEVTALQNKIHEEKEPKKDQRSIYVAQKHAVRDMQIALGFDYTDGLLTPEQLSTLWEKGLTNGWSKKP